MKNKYFTSRKFLRTLISHFPFLAVMTIIDIDGKIMLVRRKEEPQKGKWWLPGGRVYKTEPAEKAATRVAKRETGLDCSVVRFLMNIREIYPDKRLPDKKSDSLTVVYVMRPKKKGQKINIDRTSSDYMLISKIGKNLHKNLKLVLKESKILKN